MAILIPPIVYFFGCAQETDVHILYSQCLVFAYLGGYHMQTVAKLYLCIKVISVRTLGNDIMDNWSSIETALSLVQYVSY